jgi:hypothetical protein
LRSPWLIDLSAKGLGNEGNSAEKMNDITRKAAM